MNRTIPMAALVRLLLSTCLQGRAQPNANGTTPPSATASYPPLAVEMLKKLKLLGGDLVQQPGS